MARLYVSPMLRRLSERLPAVDAGLRKLERFAVTTVWKLTAGRPVQQASDWGGRFGAWIGPKLRKNRHVIRNLRVVCPDASEAEIAETAKGVWRQIGMSLAEYPHLTTLCDKANGHFEYRSKIPKERLVSGQTGFVMVAMHQANWNLHAMAGELGEFPLDVVFAEQKDPHMESLIAKHRNAMPCGFIHVRDIPRGMMENLKAGRHVGLFVDHRIDTGEPVDFFGRPANTTIIPARVAQKLNTGLVPARLERLPNCRFRLSLDEPIYADPSIADRRCQAIDMMRRVNLRFEAWVRDKPADWFCVKRRWAKHSSTVGPSGHDELNAKTFEMT